MTIDRFKNSLREKRDAIDENDPAKAQSNISPVSQYFSDPLFVQGLIFGSLPIALSLAAITYAYREDRSKTSKYGVYKYALIFVLILIFSIPFIMKHTNDKLVDFINK